MTAIEKTQTINVVQRAALEAPPFSINDYIDWFEKINLNTFVWQIIALIVIFSFQKQIRAFLQGLIDKIPQMKSAPGFVFDDISKETKDAVEQASDRLQEEIKAYEAVAEKDPNIVFLTIFIDIESKLSEIYSKYYDESKDISFIRPNTHSGIRNLVDRNVLDQRALAIFEDVRRIRNGIAHGEKPLKNTKEAMPYFEALLLLKDIVSEGHEKALQNKERKKKAINQ